MRMLCLFLALLEPFAAAPAAAQERLRISTTTSTENSGLLGVLLPPFGTRCGCKVDVIAVGTGKALKLGEAGDVDLVFVHARELEDRFVSAGFGVERRDVMYNDFVVVGPPDDPAGVMHAKTAADAFRAVAAREAPFVSRGDDSGTHRKEREVWKAAGVEPKGKWYLEAGQGMGEVLQMATQRRAYTLSDRGTHIAYRRKTDLAVVHEGDPSLRNPYGVIAVNPEKHPNVKHDLARKFIEFVTGKEGQRIIANFRIGGEPLFFPSAPGGK